MTKPIKVADDHFEIGGTSKSVRGNHLCTCTYVEQCHYNFE